MGHAETESLLMMQPGKPLSQKLSRPISANPWHRLGYKKKNKLLIQSHFVSISAIVTWVTDISQKSYQYLYNTWGVVFF